MPSVFDGIIDMIFLFSFWLSFAPGDVVVLFQKFRGCLHTKSIMHLDEQVYFNFSLFFALIYFVHNFEARIFY